jgi:hypothetical protein
MQRFKRITQIKINSKVVKSDLPTTNKNLTKSNTLHLCNTLMDDL